MASLFHRDLHASGSHAQLRARLLAFVFQNHDGHTLVVLHRHGAGASGDSECRASDNLAHVCVKKLIFTLYETRRA